MKKLFLKKLFAKVQRDLIKKNITDDNTLFAFGKEVLHNDNKSKSLLRRKTLWRSKLKKDL
jgi:hypothetical protein